MARVLTSVIAALLLVTLEGRGEELLWPLPGHRTLTGGYADSRTDHFHGGVDLRTRGKHLPVVAPSDGWVERIAISPSGYGRVLYFRLADERTAVFGHLSRFCDVVEHAVRDSQLVVGTYRVNLIYDEPAAEFRFRRGDTLAFTGETGRGAPHLHFEIREGAVQTDPLASYEPEDTDSPIIVGAHWIALDDYSLTSSGAAISLIEINDGRWEGDPIRANGALGLILRCFDPGPWGRHAHPSEIRVRANGKVIYRVLPSRIDLFGPKDIHQKLVWRERKHRDLDLRRLFECPPHPSARSDDWSGEGWISTDEPAEVVIEVVDRAGNTSTLSVPVTAPEPEQPAVQTGEHSTSMGRFEVSGEATALSWLMLRNPGIREIEINDEDTGFPDRLQVSYELDEGDMREGLYFFRRKPGGGRSAMWTVPDDDARTMSFYTQRGGRFGIARDDTPPKLLVSTRTGRLSFTLRDPETGIDDSTVRCRVDGQTAIAEYEYEEDGGAIWTPQTLAAGEHRVEFEAANRAGVRKQWDVTVTLR